jgi:hypothetical protein
MIKALQQKEKMEQKAEQMMEFFQRATTQNNNRIRLAIKSITERIKSITERGMKRFVQQIFAISGKIVTKNGEIKQLILNPFYPIIDRIKMAFEALLQPYEITVVLGKT